MSPKACKIDPQVSSQVIQRAARIHIITLPSFEHIYKLKLQRNYPVGIYNLYNKMLRPEVFNDVKIM